MLQADAGMGGGVDLGQFADADAGVDLLRLQTLVAPQGLGGAGVSAASGPPCVAQQWKRPGLPSAERLLAQYGSSAPISNSANMAMYWKSPDQV